MKKNIINNRILSKLPKKVNLNNIIYDISKIKYLPSFTKEWKDTIYSYNKNTMKNIPSNHFNINKIIQSYFNLYIRALALKKRVKVTTKRVKVSKFSAKRVKVTKAIRKK